MKYIIFLLLSGLLTTAYCSAQPPPPPKLTPTPRSTAVALYPIEFSANDTCNLVINGTDYGIIDKNSQKIIRLRFGNYRLFFESLETGETITNRSFRFNKDSVSAGKYIYAITFKGRLIGNR